MDQFYAMANIQAALFIYLAVGFVTRKLNILTPQVRAGVTNLLIYVFLPCMVISSFNQELTPELLTSGFTMFLIAVAMSLFAWIVGWLFWGRAETRRTAVFRYGTLVANSGFAGLPLIGSAFGAEGLFLASIYIIPNRIFMWTLGLAFFYKGKDQSILKRLLLNPGIIAVIIGLGRLVLQVPLPTFLDQAMSSMGNSTTSLSMIIVGAILADIKGTKLVDKEVLLLSFIRLIFLPLCAFFVLSYFGFQTLGTSVTVILAGMPIATTTAILADKYDGDSAFASQCIFVTTVISLFTIPLLTLLLN